MINTQQLKKLTAKGASLRKRVANLAEPEGEWKTINGRHVLVGKGETPLQALNKSLGSSPKPDRTHLVSVRVQDPTLVASGAKDILKKIRVTASSTEEAMKKAEAFYKKQGFKNIKPFLAEKIAPPIKADLLDRNFDKYKSFPSEAVISRSKRGTIHVVHEDGILRYRGVTRGGENLGVKHSWDAAKDDVQSHGFINVGSGFRAKDIPWKDVKIK